MTFRSEKHRGNRSKSLTEKYFTRKSLILKDLAKTIAKSLIPKDRIQGGSTNLSQNRIVQQI